MPARYALERGAWGDAAKLEPTPTKYPFTEAMTHFAARARRGPERGYWRGAEGYRADRSAVRRAEGGEQDGEQRVLANEVEVMRLASVAWVALAQKKSKQRHHTHAPGGRPRG